MYVCTCVYCLMIIKYNMFRNNPTHFRYDLCFIELHGWYYLHQIA